jgi:hypothetical protein
MYPVAPVTRTRIVASRRIPSSDFRERHVPRVRERAASDSVNFEDSKGLKVLDPG